MHMRNWDSSRHKLFAEAASPGKAGVNLNTARQRHIEEEHSMKRLLPNVFASLLLALSAHAPAQQLSGAAGKGQQSPQKAAEASFMSEIGAMRAALGRPLPDTEVVDGSIGPRV